MNNIISWIYGKFITYSPLVAALGTSNNIVRAYPNDASILPIVALIEANNPNSYFVENEPIADNQNLDVHVFTKFDVPTSSISKYVDDLMKSLLYTRDMSQDMDDPSAKVRHKVMKYSRHNIVAQDLI
jgi:hypothetical protein